MKEVADSGAELTTGGVSAQSIKPQGIGMAVAFDWGLAAQFLTMPVLPLILGKAGPFKALRFGTVGNAVVPFIVCIPVAILFAIFGEGVRRGWKWTRPVQVVFNAAGFIGGLASLLTLWQSIERGNYWPLVATVVLVIFSPLIAWRLSRPITARWFATVTSAEAQMRHGGLWPVLIALWALTGGILQALSIFNPR